MNTSIASITNSDPSETDDLIGSNAADLLARKYTLSGGYSCVRGQILGIVIIAGEVIPSLSAASDGSQTPFGIAATDVDANEDSPPADMEVLVYTRGSFNENALTLGAGHTVASIREGLRDKGIYLETPVRRYP